MQADAYQPASTCIWLADQPLASACAGLRGRRTRVGRRSRKRTQSARPTARRSPRGQRLRVRSAALSRILTCRSACLLPTPPHPLPACLAAAMYARKAVQQAEALRQQKKEEQQQLKNDKKLSWNQKVGWVFGARLPATDRSIASRLPARSPRWLIRSPLPLCSPFLPPPLSLPPPAGEAEARRGQGDPRQELCRGGEAAGPQPGRLLRV